MPIVSSDDKISVLKHIETRLRGLQELIQAQLVATDLRAQQRFDAQSLALSAAMAASEKAVQMALISAAQAVTKAEISNEKRFESVNEFRKTLSDQTNSFVQRAEAVARFDSLTEKLNLLSSRIDRTEGAGIGLSRGWGILLGAVGLLGTLSGLVMLFISRGSP